MHSSPIFTQVVHGKSEEEEQLSAAVTLATKIVDGSNMAWTQTIRYRIVKTRVCLRFPWPEYAAPDSRSQGCVCQAYFSCCLYSVRTCDEPSSVTSPCNSLGFPLCPRPADRRRLRYLILPLSNSCQPMDVGRISK
jgi:hypothetical protein